jgi:hypothetical protein
MNEKLIGKVSKTTTLPNKKRGRPKGTKNKPKLPQKETQLQKRGRPKGAKNKPKVDKVEVLAKGRRGRPKGSKNKPKSEPKQVPCIAQQVKKKELRVHAIPQALKVDEEHPLFTTAKWLAKNMHDAETQHYHRRASRNNVTFDHAVISDILGFFNVKDPEILKLVKKNNFIANITTK